MSRLFVGNFDFEHELAGVQRPKTAKLSRDLLACWLAMATAGDAIHGFEDVDVGFEDELNRIGRVMPRSSANAGDELVPWGWTESMRTLAGQLGCDYSAPEHDAVRLVNSRRFSHEYELKHGCGALGQRSICSVQDFRDETADHFTSWIAKAEFSMSSRERILGTGAATEQQVAWVAKRLDETGAVFVEPELAITEELGVQFDVQPGATTLLGASGLLTTTKGQFAGCLVRPDLIAEWERTADLLPFVAVRAWSEGYFGPLGIDAARYVQDGSLLERPVQDVNARFTMGRLALQYASSLPDLCVAWLFVSWNKDGNAADFVSAASRAVDDGVRLFRTSPFQLGSHTVQLGTLLLAGPNPTGVLNSASSLLALTGRTLRLPAR